MRWLKNLRLGEVLIQEGFITDAQLTYGLGLQKTDPAKRRLGAILVEEGLVSEDNVLLALSKRLSLKTISFNDVAVDIEAVRRIPRQVAEKYSLIGVFEYDNTLVVAVNDPLDFYAIEDVKLIVNMPIEVRISKKSEILESINYYYSEINSQKAAEIANQTTANFRVSGIEDLSQEADSTPVVSLINSIVLKAYNAGASDIHIEPFETETKIRIRVDGLIVESLSISPALHQSIIARIKIMSNLDIAEKRVPQDGHFRGKFGNIEVNIRVATLPTIVAEKAVLRFLSQNTILDNSHQYGMDKENYEKVSEILQSPHGIIYITGPTGSGKTTTLYMILQRLAEGLVNISTIEDPVEQALAGINQTQVNVQAGLSFDTGLRSILRQDPDIIMVGETRDSETASIAVRAAITGHLVLSTLHTNDAVSAVVRLADMGIEEYMIANSLVGVVAQRLVKKVCENCKTPYAASEAEKRLLMSDVTTLYKGKGCHICNNTGYKGRIAIHEILRIDNNIRSLISRKEPTESIYDYVHKNQKIISLRDSLTRLVLSGISTTQELLKLTYFVE